MPRRPDIKLAGISQHIVQRGINREPCFFADEDYHCYLHWLEKSAGDRGFYTAEKQQGDPVGNPCAYSALTVEELKGILNRRCEMQKHKAKLTPLKLLALKLL
jgi:hypothetical protein